MLSTEAIKDFQEIYKKEFGKDLSQNEASVKATQVLRLFKIVNAPVVLKKDIKSDNY